MCRHQLHVGWDGTLYDCDFNFALGLPVNDPGCRHIRDFDPLRFLNRRIATGPHCFGCTAGSGSSCGVRNCLNEEFQTRMLLPASPSPGTPGEGQGEGLLISV